MNTVVVLGATGNIGREITAQLLASGGRRVVAVARNVPRLQALARKLNAHDRLAILPGSLAGEFDAANVARSVREQGHPVIAVVSALRGSVDSGRLLDRPAPSLTRTLEADVVTPFIAAKHFLPILAESSRNGLYLLLGGPMGACAWSGYGHLSIAAAALQMMTNVVREEAKDLPVVVQQLQVGTPVRSDANEDCACPEWLGADDVGRRVVDLIDRRDATQPIVHLDNPISTRRARPALSSRSSS